MPISKMITSIDINSKAQIKLYLLFIGIQMKLTYQFKCNTILISGFFKKLKFFIYSFIYETFINISFKPSLRIMTRILISFNFHIESNHQRYRLFLQEWQICVKCIIFINVFVRIVKLKKQKKKSFFSHSLVVKIEPYLKNQHHCHLEQIIKKKKTKIER